MIIIFIIILRSSAPEANTNICTAINWNIRYVHVARPSTVFFFLVGRSSLAPPPIRCVTSTSCTSLVPIPGKSSRKYSSEGGPLTIRCNLNTQLSASEGLIAPISYDCYVMSGISHRYFRLRSLLRRPTAFVPGNPSNYVFIPKGS